MPKILIIDMYSTMQVFSKYKKRYKRAFAGQAKLSFRRWNDVHGIDAVIAKGSKSVDGIIITGSDYFVRDKVKATVPSIVFRSGIPILGICYGFQYVASMFGKKSYVTSFRQKRYRGYTREYVITRPFYVPKMRYYFYHHDYIVKVPTWLQAPITQNGRINMAYSKKHNYIGIQFHPERYTKTARVFFGKWLEYIRNI